MAPARWSTVEREPGSPIRAHWQEPGVLSSPPPTIQQLRTLIASPLCRIGSLPIIDANSCLAAARCGTSATPRPAGKLVIAAKRPPVHGAFARAPTLHLRRSSCDGISCVLAHVRAAAQNVDSRRIDGGMHPAECRAFITRVIDAVCMSGIAARLVSTASGVACPRCRRARAG